MAIPASHLLEASWEVCNKVGGIHTVVSSKLSYAQEEFPAGYLTIGPYLTENCPAFAEQEIPLALQGIAAGLEQHGVIVHYGLWLPFEQPTVLLDWNRLVPQVNEYKGKFWERYGLDTLETNFYDVDQPLLWATAVGLFADAYAGSRPEQVVLQLHEWLAAGALLVLNLDRQHAIRTVFTTHATVLGRALSAQGMNIYAGLAAIEADQEARSLGVLAKHQLEKLGATLATVFTTVSALTSQEASKFLGRTPDIITENGLDTENYPTFDELAISHRQVRHLLDDFTAAHFFPSYTFDLQKVSYQFTMGRYETHNKGYDLYLQALGALNTEMKQQHSTKTVISYFLVPGDAIRMQPAAIGQIMLYRRIQQQLQEFAARQQQGLYQSLCEEGEHVRKPILSTAEHRVVKEQMDRLLRPSQPAISPYELRNPHEDPILRLCERYGLLNREEDRVKVLFFPIYFDGFDGIFNIPFYSLLSGFDLGVFPSYYEPWGYTPMESLLMGVPALTSTLSGFGQSIAASRRSPSTGVLLLDRYAAEADAPEILLAQLRSSLRENRRQWGERRIAAYQTIQQYGWNHLYRNYRRAYGDTLTKATSHSK